MKRLLSILGLCIATGSGTALAAQDDDQLLLGVVEGVAEQMSMAEIQTKYKGLADHLSNVLNKKVKLESTQSFRSAERNLKNQRYDFVFIRPSNVAAKALRDNKYQLVASAKAADFAANFIVKKDSPIKSVADLHGKRVAMPEESSLMAQVGAAVMRDGKLNPEKESIQYARLQETVLTLVEQGHADAGVVASGQLKEWAKRGGVVAFKSKNLPFWSVIASPNVSAGDVEKAQKALVALESPDEVKRVLQPMTVKGFTVAGAQEYLDLLKWIKQ